VGGEERLHGGQNLGCGRAGHEGDAMGTSREGQQFLVHGGRGVEETLGHGVEPASPLLATARTAAVSEPSPDT